MNELQLKRCVRKTQGISIQIWFNHSMYNSVLFFEYTPQVFSTDSLGLCLQGNLSLIWKFLLDWNTWHHSWIFGRIMFFGGLKMRYYLFLLISGITLTLKPNCDSENKRVLYLWWDSRILQDFVGSKGLLWGRYMGGVCYKSCRLSMSN